MRPLHVVYILISLTLFVPNTWSAQAVNPAVCKASVVTTEVALTWSIDDEKLALLKTVKDIATKIPVIKKADVEAAISVSITNGEECCDGATKPSTYKEYKGQGSVTLDIEVYGIGGQFSKGFSVGLAGYSVIGEVKGEAGIGGGAEASGNGTVSGREGKCSCTTVKADVSVAPKVFAKIGGHIAAMLVNDATPLKPIKDIVVKAEASATIIATFSLHYQKSFGDKCPKDTTDKDGVKLCAQLPQAEFTILVEIPWFPDPSVTVTVDVFGLFMKETTFCYP